MLDLGFSLRNLLLWTSWAATLIALIAWGVFRQPPIAQGGLVLLTLACTLNILSDNAKTRRVVRAAFGEAHDPHEPGRLTTIP